MKTYYIIAILIVVILGGWWFYSVYSPAALDSSDIGVPPEEEAGMTAPLLTAPNAIYMADQKPGKTPLLNFVRFRNTGFVAIHEISGSAPGAIIGVSHYLSSGEYRDVSINLDREAADGERFIAMLHADKDNNEVFSAASDPAVKDDDGNIIMMSFGVDADADPNVEIQL